MFLSIYTIKDCKVRLENLLVYEKEIKQAYYDVDTSTVRLYLQEVKYLDENDE